jgi:hypothetical protein
MLMIVDVIEYQCQTLVQMNEYLQNACPTSLVASQGTEALQEVGADFKKFK